MDQQELNPKKLEVPWSDTQQAPPSLLSNVLARLDERQHYRQTELAPAQRRAGLQHTAWEIRAAAVSALDGKTDTQTLEQLKVVLQDEHRLVRVAALRVIGHMGRQAPLEYLLQALTDNAWEVREMAILALAELDAQTPDLLTSLLRVARDDPYTAVREVAQYTLDRHQAEQVPQHATPQLPANTNQDDQATLSTSWLTLTRRHAILFVRQIPLIHKSIWIGAILIILLGMLITLYPFIEQAATIQQAGLSLAAFITISAGVGTAFLFGGENDSGLELTLATPTSIRLMMLFRFVIVAGYNLLISLLASGLIAILHGESLWAIIHLWLGPAILVALTAFSVSLLLSSWLALAVTFIIEASHVITLQLDHFQISFDYARNTNWASNPYVFIAATLLLLVAIYYAPRQPRLSSL